MIGPLVDYSHRDGCGVVPHPTILDHADVEFDDLAVLNAALASNAVHHFVVQRDANGARKNAVPEPITEKRALHASFVHEIGGRVIHLFRRNAGANHFTDSIENVARAAARLPHLFDFLHALNRNHAGTLSSISREISAKTVSRSRLPSIRRKIDILP